MGLSLFEILVIVGVVVLLFGAKRIPELARALGKASHEFSKAKSGLEKESREFLDAAQKSAEAADAKKESSEDKK